MTVHDLLIALRHKFRDLEYHEAQLKQLAPASHTDKRLPEYDDRRTYEKRRDEDWQRMRALMQAYEEVPERHFQRHAARLEEFRLGGDFDESVFIMTKFADPKDGAIAGELDKVIKTVVKGVEGRGYIARIASQQGYQDLLWDNVELYLCGCARGIAIVEDKYRKELNPNVAMEWGWMRGMGRKVLFLGEKAFAHGRADWEGLIKHTFEWKDPSPGVKAALDAFLPRK